MRRLARLACAGLLGVLGVAHAAELTVDVAAVDPHGREPVAVWLRASSAGWETARAGDGFSGNPPALGRPRFARLRFAVSAAGATAAVRMR